MEKSTAEKALSLNLVRPLYGTIAEIGAGQEVARWFFKVGGAAGTIAKAMSAYDMKFSDEIYGREDSGRYVVESRVRKMVAHEYELLETRLTDEDHENRFYFAFADTVAAKSFKYKGDCHGWMALKFQNTPDEPASQVILHIRMRDMSNLHQQEALGVLGVNLIYACYNHVNDLSTFLKSLLDGGLGDRLEINVVRFEGHHFSEVDQTQVNLNMFYLGLTSTVLLPAGRPASHLAEEFYKKMVIIHRGQFDPPLKTDLDILRSARDHYCGAETKDFCDPYLVSEIYFDREQDSFEQLQRKVKLLQRCDQNIMVTDFLRTFQLTEYVANFTSNHINVVFRSTKVIDILENERLASLDRLARIFNERTRMYIYPVSAERVPDHLKQDTEAKLFNLSNYKPSELNINLYRHLIVSEYIQELKNFDADLAGWDAESAKDLENSNSDQWKTLLACRLDK